MRLKNKKILIISTDPWGSIYLSKHNYAIELAKKNNIVYFLNPPEFYKFKAKRISIKPSEIKNLFIISYAPWFPLFFKFKLPFVFNILLEWQVRKLLKQLNTKIDIVWDFNAHPFFFDLKIFDAQLSILHPVDKILHKVDNRGADIIFSISEEILSMIDAGNTPKKFINHGLAPQFSKSQNEQETPAVSNQVKVCYIGNLMIYSLDHGLLKTLINKYPDIEFHFIGPYKITGNPLGSNASENTEDFVQFLQHQKNVFLHGIIKSNELPNMLKQFDAFLITYKASKYFSCDNSHKVLEYLSTGKVIISTFLKNYENSDMIVMSPKDNNSQLMNLFDTVINNIQWYNNKEHTEKRILYALDNTYEKQIDRIEHFLDSYKL